MKEKQKKRNSLWIEELNASSVFVAFGVGNARRFSRRR